MGYFTSEQSGSEITPDGVALERCDTCQRFPSDEAAAAAAWGHFCALFEGVGGDADAALHEIIDHTTGATRAAFEALREGLRRYVERLRRYVERDESTHECPDNPHLPCGECSGDPVCECPPGDCPED